MPADSKLDPPLFGRSLRDREHRYECAAIGFGLKLHVTFNLGEQGMVSAHADIKAGVPGGAALTRDDVARDHALAAENLDAKALALGITSVSRGSACFFMSHGSVSKPDRYLVQFLE